MPAILDTATVLLPSGVLSANTDGTPLQLFPRQLATSAWVVHVSVPPAAAATFVLAVASTSGGTYSEIARLAWPAGTTGAQQVPVGVQGNMAQFRNNTALWVRVSVTTSGALTMSGSWLTTPTDGGPGLASRSYHLDGINAA